MNRLIRFLLLAIVLMNTMNAEAVIRCFDCHGTRNPEDVRPVDAAYRNITTGGFQGTHRSHMPSGVSESSCSTCHPGSASYDSSHRDGLIRLSKNIKNSPQNARYKNLTTPFPQTATPNPGTCTSVNCHFEKETPRWGTLVPFAAPSDCSQCHGAPPSDGSHPAITGSGLKHGDYYGTGIASCALCHVGHTTFSHATSAGRSLILKFTAEPNSGGSYSKTTNLTYPEYLPSVTPKEQRNGTCEGLYCHSNGVGGTPRTVPVWGGTLPTDCTGCHAGAGDSTELGGRHGKHTGASGYAFTCERCHKGTAAGSLTISDRGLHVNKTSDVMFRDGGTYASATKDCRNAYCHSDGNGGAAALPVKWTDTGTMTCFSCHKGRTGDNAFANCSTIHGIWSSARQVCTPSVSMESNGHARLVGPQWIRKYPCTYCHNATVDANGNISDRTRHLNKVKDVVMDPQWAIVGKPGPSYDSATKVCANIYCHSDGTNNPETVRPFAWTEGKTNCNTCHGHPIGTCSSTNCHDGRIDQVTGKKWSLPPIYGNSSSYKWPEGQEWKAAIPMFKNEGAGTPRANSHPRHVETDFTCDRCHFVTIKNTGDNCNTTTCHNGSTKYMGESSHLDPVYHVNRAKDVVFKNNSGTYNPTTKTCSNTVCHVGSQPQWGGSVSSAVICLDCHGTSGADVDDFNAFNGVQGKINLTEWVVAGHGRYSSAGRYPVSGNPAANFPGNPCWYCHDNSVLHKDKANPYRLRMHQQFSKRFERECVYCHMEGEVYECVGCHVSKDSIAVQMQATSARLKHSNNVYLDGCRNLNCHGSDVHKTGAGYWSTEQKLDVRNQYLMMGVCLQCHDDDSGGQCTSCHIPTEENLRKYSLGFDPGMTGTRFIKPKKARASAAHFGYKHGRAFDSTGGWEKDPVTGKPKGIWKGGKFCWDCHDPHGDKNIYMIQNKVATSTDGTFGIPQARAEVSFTRKLSGTDYAKSDGTINGICNVCHSSDSKHYTKDGGDRHNSSRVCTTCHEHRFADSHANKQSCNTVDCHINKKPVPKHTAFGLPRDCVKCHAGIIGKRMDVMTQFKSNSHHVQGVEVTNRHCYQCHWESTKAGLIDVNYHTGYNYKTYTSVKNAVVDLVVYGANKRPTVYKEYSTAIRFLASNMSSDNATARTESAKVTNHCLSCHSDQNNDFKPFDDCKTPRQYAWDFQSIDARYSQLWTATWGKYPSTAGAAPKNITKSFSAHGNATANKGGFSSYSGLDGSIPNSRNGSNNVTCYDCHSSHGSSAVGVTSSYLTFNNTRNGGNLKETQAGKGGYAMTYKASANADRNGVNPYNTGAGQCFDCHNNATAGTTPWGYNSTFGAEAPIMGYNDTVRFGQGIKASVGRYVERAEMTTIRSSHFNAFSSLKRGASGTINGLCTPCHDPHGVSPTLGSDQSYALPLLKGTWMTSPYKEDGPPPLPSGANAVPPKSWGNALARPTVTPKTNFNIDRNTFGATGKIAETADKFAGLCLNCHSQTNLTGGTETQWFGVDRIHRSVKGWGEGGVNKEHNYSCSKCHQPHNSGLPRLMKTNCLDAKHRGNSVKDGVPWAADKQVPYSADGNGREHRGYPIGSIYGNALEATTACHVSRFNRTYNSSSPPAEWPNGNLWNNVTPW
jgi:predicted CxxxxCH...CXXCH cytochrome family protein